MESNNNTSVVKDKRFKQSVYKHLLDLQYPNYWHSKLWGEMPNVNATNNDDTFNAKGVKRIYEVMTESSWTNLIAKYNSIKSSGVGYGAIIIDYKKDFKGDKIPYIQVAQGVVRYNSYKETDNYIEVVEKFQRGIPLSSVPYIVITTYGRMMNSQRYEAEALSEQGDMTTDTFNAYNNEVDKINNTTIEPIRHNLGFVPASIFRNRVDDEHYDYGQNDLNGYQDFIANIDIMSNRLNNDVDKETTHISRTLATGNVIGADFGESEDGIFDFDNQDGQVKETFRTIDTEEGVDSVIIAGTITIDKLEPLIKSKLSELYQMTGIQSGYDAEGKTNDTTAKVTTIGDPAYKEAILRKNIEKEFWTKLFQKVIQLDNSDVWKNIDCIEIEPKVSDFRMMTMMIDNMDKVSKYMPNKDMFIKTFGLSDHLAEQMVIDKEEEAKKYMTSALPTMNGNIPQNLELKDIDWATQKEEEVKVEKDIKEEAE